MNKVLMYCIFILMVVSVLAGCGASPVSTPVNNISLTVTSTPLPSTTEISLDPSMTPDVCSSGLVEAEVQKVHRHMREFDDASILASNMPREQLNDSIAELQRIRREAEDEQIPACLTDLKTYQVDHMNSVINTLLAFVGGTDAQVLEASITVARDQHDKYTLELARMLGLTVVPATVPVINTPVETATP